MFPSEIAFGFVFYLSLHCCFLFERPTLMIYLTMTFLTTNGYILNTVKLELA